MDRAARSWLAIASTTAVLFALSVVLVPRSVVVARFDEDVMAWMSGIRQPGLTKIVQFITDLGSYYPVTLLSLALALVLGLHTQRLLEPLVLLAALEAGSSLVDIFKVVTDRARPPIEGMLGPPVFDYSFPSGHTAGGTVLYVLGAVLLAQTQTRGSGRRLVVAAGCVIAGLIGLSRVYLGYHWLTDAAGAWLLALVMTSVGMVLVLANPRPNPGTTVRDGVAPRGALARVSDLAVGYRPDIDGGPLRRRSTGQTRSIAAQPRT